MTDTERRIITGIGNIYVEINYLGLNSGGSDVLEAGKEYRASTYETRLGGSVVNFVQQAKKLGAEVGLIGKIGDDEAGRKLLDLLSAAEISSDLIVKSLDVQTSVDTGIVFEHSGDNIQFVAGNANQSLKREDIDLENAHFNQVQAVYLGGFLKQESLYREYPTLLEAFSKKGIRIFLDHGRIPVDTSDEKVKALHEAMKFLEGYLPNEEELLTITGGSTLDEALEVALDLGPKFVAVKLGANGCRVRTQQEDISISGHNVKVISSVGAGDAFNAGFITQYLSGKSLRECAEFANATAAIRVSNNYMPDTKEVESFL